MIYPRAIIPTVLIPFTLLSVILSSIASFIAALFGLHLNTEGPRRLLEALLKPRVLITGLLLNGAIFAGVRGWAYWRTLPRFEATITRENRALAKPSDREYPDTVEATLLAPSRLAPAGALETVWTSHLSGGSFAGAARSGDSLFLGTEAGRIEELDVLSGGARRSFYIGTPVSSAPLIHGGALFSGEGTHDTHHARVYKFDLRSGGFVGAYPTKGHTEGRLVAATWKGKDYLFVPAGADGMHAVNPATLEKIWQRTEGHSDASVAFAEGTAFWGTGREKNAEVASRVWAVAVDVADGALKWKRELPGSSWMQPVIVGAEVCFPVGEIYFPSEVGGVFCFDRVSGAPGAAFFLGAPIVASPVVKGGDLIVTDFVGRLRRLSMATRREVWTTETDGTDYSVEGASLDPERGVVVYASRKGGLFVLDPESGKILVRWSPEAPGQWASTYAPVERANGAWIIADMEGVVRCLRPRKDAAAESDRR